MQMNDEIRIAASREKVYAALNDVEILKAAIPGCEEIEKISETEMTATVIAKVGPVKAKFKGKVTLSDLNPPVGYTISGEGTGGPAGFAKGGASVTLVEDGNATILRYEVNASVGGKLAQIGGRLIDSTSKKLAGEFFKSFEELVSEGGADEAVEETPAAAEAAATGGMGPLAWVLIGGAVVAAILIIANM